MRSGITFKCDLLNDLVPSCMVKVRCFVLLVVMEALNGVLRKVDILLKYEPSIKAQCTLLLDVIKPSSKSS